MRNGKNPKGPGRYGFNRKQLLLGGFGEAITREQGVSCFELTVVVSCRVLEPVHPTGGKREYMGVHLKSLKSQKYP